MLQCTKSQNCMTCRCSYTCSLCNVDRYMFWERNASFEIQHRDSGDTVLSRETFPHQMKRTWETTYSRVTEMMNSENSQFETPTMLMSLQGTGTGAPRSQSTAATAARCLLGPFADMHNSQGDYCTCFLVLVFPVLSLMYLAINSFLPERKKNFQ